MVINWHLLHHHHHQLYRKQVKRKTKMFGTVSDEREISVPASEAWKLYGSLQLSKFVAEKLPGMASKIDVVQWDGGVGTIIEIFYAPAPGRERLKSYKEKFTVVDDEKRVKVAEVVEGGYLDLGFTMYRVRFEVIEKDRISNNQCITRATIEYEVKDDVAANAAALVSIQPLVTVLEAK